MKLLALSIDGFRGIESARLRFRDHDVLIGPNGSGKTAIIDALSLVFARTRLVRDLTEHDFFGSDPRETSRIRIVATIGGFSGNDPEHHDNWFRLGRAVPKWWNESAGVVEAEPSESAPQLCAQIAFAARFDLDDLAVQQVRYFHDDDGVQDVFQEDAVDYVPARLYDEIGYFVLPARRTWEGVASFSSDLFRNAVATIGGIPAPAILEERDRLRAPARPLEREGALASLVGRVNDQLAQLFPSAPQFQLRITATDSESVLRSLVPHYQAPGGVPLPVARHGMGMLSLQTLVLLLEIGRERRSKGKPFLLAIEEPELHIAPGLQRRLISQAISIAEQSICTTHSPRVASVYPATNVVVLDRRAKELATTRLREAPLGSSATQAERKLYLDERARVVEALMQPVVLVPEGRSDYEWLRVLSDLVETSEWPAPFEVGAVPPFGSVVGVIPTHEATITNTTRELSRLRGGITPLVDGDTNGGQYLGEVQKLTPPPSRALRWRDDWAIEDAIGWILAADGATVLPSLRERLPELQSIQSVADLVGCLKIKNGPARLKNNYAAFEEIAAVIRSSAQCRERTQRLLEAITRACLGSHGECALLKCEGSADGCLVFTISP